MWGLGRDGTLVVVVVVVAGDGGETHVTVALRLFVRGTACLVREQEAIPSCWAAAP